MTLEQLLAEMEFQCLKGSMDIPIEDIIYDSRKVTANTVFVCISGTAVDAHKFIPGAIEKGAAAIIVEKDVEVDGDVTVIRVGSTRKALALMSCAYFGYPAKEMTTIGLTGTKGKTTTTYMVQEMIQNAGGIVGVIGTIGAVIAGEKIKTANTTPESYELQKLFRQMVDKGCGYVVMEVSSQGLKMHRVAGIHFDYGIFTNFSEDHIGTGEHESMEEYLYCKSLLFQQCKVGIINIDDANWEGVIKGHTCEIQTFSTSMKAMGASEKAMGASEKAMGASEKADLRAGDIEFLSYPGFLGMQFNTSGIMNLKVKIDMPGRFSVYNALTALMICKNLGIKEEYMLKGLFEIKVRGRVEIVPTNGNYTIMIDYAHNAASVGSLMATIKEYNPKRIVCIYGGGGNRARVRRYDMGEICGKMADLSILTCDNPRDEEIEAINEDIKVGLARSNGKYIEILDRTEAIHYSMDHAQDGDLIMLIGKGHEEYQDIKGKKYYYNEKEVILEYAAR